MTEWFKFPSQLADDRQVKAIALNLRQPRAVVIGLWAMILCYADDSSQPGKLVLGKFSLGPMVAKESGLDSSIASQMIDAFIEFGMLACIDGLLTVVDWQELYQAPDQWNLSKYREQIFARDGACVYCGNPPECLDHIIPRTRGGRNQFNNLVASCSRCNQSKYNHIMDEWYRQQSFFEKKRLEYVRYIMRQTYN